MIRPYKNREIDPAKPVYVYRNLADKHNGLGKWSILQGSHVVAHAAELVMVGFGDRRVEFIVRPGGFKRAQAEQAKNVHAFFKGQICPVSSIPEWRKLVIEHVGDFSPVQYDFRRGDRFFNVNSGEDVADADVALLSRDGAFYQEYYH